MPGEYRIIKNAPFPLRRQDSGTTLNISKDGGALAAASSTPAETPAASGIYYNLLSATEMAADHVFYKGAAGNDKSDGTLIPEPCIDSGVAQSATSTTITLRSGAPSFDLTNTRIEIVRGAGKDASSRLITAYDTTTKVATIRPDWSASNQPDNTSVYKVTMLEKANVMQLDGSSSALQYLADFWLNAYKTGVVAAGSTTSVINSNMTGYGTNALVGKALMCLGTVNNGLMSAITAYNTATGAMTVSPAFPSAPTASDRIAVFGLTG